MFQRRKQIRTQAPFLFADSIEIPALQQQCKETLSEIFRLFRPDALPPYKTLNWFPVGAAKFLKCPFCSWRWTLRRQDYAPMGCCKCGAVISIFASRRSHVIIDRRHAVIQSSCHAQSKPAVCHVVSFDFAQDRLCRDIYGYACFDVETFDLLTARSLSLWPSRRSRRFPRPLGSPLRSE